MGLTKEQDAFIAKTLEVYVNDPEKCAIYAGECQYRVELEDGRVLKCALGQHIKDGAYSDEMEGINADTLLDDWSEDFLTDEAKKADLPYRVWFEVQGLHDAIARNCSRSLLDRTFDNLTIESKDSLPLTKEVLSKYEQR